MSEHQWLYNIFWIFGTLVFIAFFSGMEIAFISANRLSLELKRKQPTYKGKLLSKFLNSPAKFIGVNLIGFNIFLVIYGLLFSQLLGQTIWNLFKIQNEYVRLVFDTLFATLIVLIIGEFLPKSIFRAKANSLLSFFAPVSNFFYKIFYPFTYLFVNISQWILKYVFNVRVKNNQEPFSNLDLEHMFQQSKQQEDDKNELNTELFENALSLPNIKVRQCFIPRTEIEGVDINEPIENVKEIFINTKLSKLLVYDNSIDKIQGYVHQLDMFAKPDNLKSILHPIFAVPESMSATELINKFTKQGKSMAWVVDEFGGTAGIVTMEDVLEELFGDIQDEYDTDEFVEKQLSASEFIFSGRLEVDYLAEKYNLEFPEKATGTLSGFIINNHGSLPKLKEHIIIDNHQYDILSMSDTKIDIVKIKVL